MSGDVAAPGRRTFRLSPPVLILLVPMAAINFTAFVLPIVSLGRISLIAPRPGGVLTGEYGFSNYVDFFTDAFNYALLTNSLMLSAAVTVITLLCAYPIALFLYRVSPRWRNILFVVTVSPLLVSSVVRTYGWMVLLGAQGPINGSLLALGLIDTPLRLINNALGVFIGLVQILIPYMALSLIAGFGKLDQSLEEAAASLGAGAFTRLRRVIIPLSLPGVALGCLLCFVMAISSFITPKLLGGGRVYLLATEIYDQAVIQLEWTRAAAISVIVLAIFILAMTLYTRLTRRFD